MLLERDFMQRAKFACRERAELSKPRGQGGTDFHKAALPRLGFARRDFNMTTHAPNVRPVQPQQFGGAKSGQPANGNHCLQRAVRRFQQGTEFIWRVKLDFRRIRVLRSHRVRLIQTMANSQVILANAPRKKLREGGAMMVPAFGREFGNEFRGEEAVQVVLANIANCIAGKSAGKPAKLNRPVVMIFGGQLRPLAVAALRAGFLGGNEFPGRCRELLALHRRNGAGEALDGFRQCPPAQLGSSLALLGDRRQQGNFAPGGLIECAEPFNGGKGVGCLCRREHDSLGILRQFPYQRLAEFLCTTLASIGREGFHLPLARRIPSHAVGIPATAGPVNLGQDLVSVFDPLWPLRHICITAFEVFLCQICV